MKMWSEFIFLLFIIYKAEAKLPEDEGSEIRLSYSSQNNESYTVWKNKPLKIVIENAYARYVWCNSFYVNNEMGRYSQFVPATKFTLDINSILNIPKVTDEMNTMWKCTVLTNLWGLGEPFEYKGQSYSLKDFSFQVHVKGAGKEAPQTILVNNMVVPAVRDDQTEKDVDFTADNITCVNLLNEDKATLMIEYEMADTTSGGTSIRRINNNRPAYFLIALGIAIVIIILVIIILVKKQCFVRLCLPIPAPRRDPASVFYVNLLSVCRPINEREAAALPENIYEEPASVFYVNLLSACRPINEREAAALPENIYEEIPLGDLSNINSNRNKSDNQNDHLPNEDSHQYTEIDYAQCKPQGTEAPHKNNYIYDEPYPQ